MKLNPYDIDIQPEELAQLNTPDSFKNSLSYDDVQLSKDLPIVVKYDYIDLDVTDYHFKQEFLLRDTQEYFTMMKEISSSTINDLEEKARRDKSYHFYRSNFSGNVRKAVKQIMPDADESMIVYHLNTPVLIFQLEKIISSEILTISHQVYFYQLTRSKS